MCSHEVCATHVLIKFCYGGLVTKACPTLVIPWTIVCQAPLSMGFSRQEYWSRLPFPSPRDPPNPGIEPRSPALEVATREAELQGKLSYKGSLLVFLINLSFNSLIYKIPAMEPKLHTGKRKFFPPLYILLAAETYLPPMFVHALPTPDAKSHIIPSENLPFCIWIQTKDRYTLAK